jgi:hypothetical protein
MPSGPKPPIPDVVEVVLRLKYAGQEVRNVMHFGPGTPGTPIAESVVGQNVADWWKSQLRPHIPNSVELYAVDARYLGAAEDAGTIVTAGLPSTGAYANESLPNNVAACVSIVTAKRGRAFRGRIFHVGIGVDQVGGNILNADYVVNIRAAYEKLLSTESGGVEGLGLAVASFQLGANWRSPTGLYTLATGIIINNVVDSQRRRLPGRGR